MKAAPGNSAFKLSAALGEFCRSVEGSETPDALLSAVSGKIRAIFSAHTSFHFLAPSPLTKNNSAATPPEMARLHQRIETTRQLEQDAEPSNAVF